MSKEESLFIVEELIDYLPKLMDQEGQSWVDYDMALLKLAPEPGPDAPEASTYAKNCRALTQFATVAHVVSGLETIKANLEYKLRPGRIPRQKTPPLLKNVRNENIGGKDMKIHGPLEVFPFMHKIEVWARAEAAAEQDFEANEEVNMKKSENEDDETGITVILGSGNQTLLTLFDILNALFIMPSFHPVLVKHHHIRPHLYQLCTELFAPLIKRGFLHQVIDNGIPEVTNILSNPKVKHVHMTGGSATSIKIEKTIADSRPHLTTQEVQKMFTSELGCVTPWIFAPCHYTKGELCNAAKHIVISKKSNAGANCLNGQAVILASGWKQKDEFKKILLETFEKTSTDPVYYPGTLKNVQNIVSHYGEDSDRVKQVAGLKVKCALDDDDPLFVQPYIIDCGTFGEDDFDNYALLNEAFGPVLAIAEVPGGDGGDSQYLLDHAVPFVNNKDNIFGSLSCSLVYPEKNKNDVAIKEATGALNYGCVAHNTWSLYGGIAIPLGGSWGGSYAEPLGQSGRGLIGNAFQIENVEKTVVYSRSLASRIIIDKDVKLPLFLVNGLSAVYVNKSPWRLISDAFTSLFRPSSTASTK